MTMSIVLLKKTFEYWGSGRCLEEMHDRIILHVEAQWRKSKLFNIEHWQFSKLDLKDPLRNIDFILEAFSSHIKVLRREETRKFHDSNETAALAYWKREAKNVIQLTPSALRLTKATMITEHSHTNQRDQKSPPQRTSSTTKPFPLISNRSTELKEALLRTQSRHIFSAAQTSDEDITNGILKNISAYWLAKATHFPLSRLTIKERLRGEQGESVHWHAYRSVTCSDLSDYQTGHQISRGRECWQSWSQKSQQIDIITRKWGKAERETKQSRMQVM